MSTTTELLAAPDSPYEFSVNLPPGAVLRGAPPYPTLTVESAQTLDVTALQVHRLTVRTDTDERYDVLRLVAIADGPDGEMEVEVGERTVIPTVMTREAKPGKCPSCGLPILSETTTYDGLCGECAAFNAEGEGE